jgi:hypothetical protein
MKIKFYSLFLVAFFLGLPLVGQAAFRWPWQAKVSAPAVVAPVVNAEALRNINAKVEQWEKLVAVKSFKPGQAYQAEFTAKELEALTRETINKIKNPSLEASSFTVELATGKVVLNATILKPIRFKVQVSIGAKISHGRLITEVSSARVGVFTVGGHIVERFAKEVFGDKWRDELNPSNFFWDKIDISAERVSVSGHTIKNK